MRPMGWLGALLIAWLSPVAGLAGGNAESWDSIRRGMTPAAAPAPAAQRARALELEAQIRGAARDVERDADQQRLAREGDAADLEEERREDERRTATWRLERDLERAQLESLAGEDPDARQRVRAFELERDIEAARDEVEEVIDERVVEAGLEERVDPLGSR